MPLTALFLSFELGQTPEAFRLSMALPEMCREEVKPGCRQQLKCLPGADLTYSFTLRDGNGLRNLLGWTSQSWLLRTSRMPRRHVPNESSTLPAFLGVPVALALPGDDFAAPVFDLGVAFFGDGFGMLAA